MRITVPAFTAERLREEFSETARRAWELGGPYRRSGSPRSWRVVVAWRLAHALGVLG